MIRWCLEAAADLVGIRDYITLDNPAAAIAQCELIEKAIGQIAKFPKSAPKTRRPQTRGLAVPKTPYIIFYRIHRDAVILVRILHGAMRRPRSLR